MRMVLHAVSLTSFFLLSEPDGEAEQSDPLEALAALGDEMAESTPEGGGSIRAKREADLTAIRRLQDKRNIEAQVESVNRSRFPLVALKLRVRRPAKEGSGKDRLKRNAELVVIPDMKVNGTEVDLTDPETLINAGAFYLRRGDRVMVRLGEKAGKAWKADYIERK